MNLSRLVRSFAVGAKGTVLVETAMVTALSVFLGLGLVQLGLYLQDYSSLNTVTYELARNLSGTPGMDTLDWADPENEARQTVTGKVAQLLDIYEFPETGRQVEASYDAVTNIISIEIGALASSTGTRFFNELAVSKKHEFLYLFALDTEETSETNEKEVEDGGKEDSGSDLGTNKYF